MEVPPTYLPPRRSKNGLLIGIIVGAICLCCLLGSLVVGGGWFAFRSVSGTAGCVITFTEMSKAMTKYESSHKGKLPKADTWQDDLRSDLRKSLLPKEQAGPFPQISPDGDWGCRESDGASTGLAFNSDVSGKSLDDIKDSEKTVVLFETIKPEKNQHMKYSRLDPKTSPKIFGSPRGWFFITANGDVWTDSPKKGPQRIGNSNMGANVQFHS
ncbi:MAG: hypothetical protein P4L46_18105 [Fimbriimonas sp.]|nr:hypothetical protein [Fimbriimonas sp.]